MIDPDQLPHLAYHAERVAARRLVHASGMSMEQALRQILEQAAESAGLAVLLARRAAQLAAAAERASVRQGRRADALARHQMKHEGEPTPWKGWFDGSAHPNPGRCGIGAVLTGPNDVRIEISQAAGHGNSSEAEYRALLAVLAAAVAAGASGLMVYGDSQVVINDVMGDAGSAASSLGIYREQACSLMAQLPGVSLRWVPRHKNPAADALSQRAIELHPATQPE